MRKAAMELKMTFNEDAENYDRWRPNYVPELFGKIIRCSGLDASKEALEIGIGTGQATQPILQTGCHVTAIEIGINLASYARNKFREYQNLEIKNIAFEDFVSEDNSFDLVYSATAFHWIPPEIGYPKVFRLLKSGGTLALFWNHPFAARKNEPLHVAIQKIYAKYRPSSRKPVEFGRRDCQEKLDVIKEWGFNDVTLDLYHQTRTFDAESYVSLLNTYSDHRAMPKEQKAPFESEIRETISRFGGKFTIYDTMDLYLAKKP